MQIYLIEIFFGRFCFVNDCVVNLCFTQTQAGDQIAPDQDTLFMTVGVLTFNSWKPLSDARTSLLWLFFAPFSNSNRSSKTDLLFCVFSFAGFLEQIYIEVVEKKNSFR